MSRLRWHGGRHGISDRPRYGWNRGQVNHRRDTRDQPVEDGRVQDRPLLDVHVHAVKVLARAGREVVHDDHVETVLGHVPSEVRSDEPRPAGDEYPHGDPQVTTSAG
jgi:hypothetical protein